MKHWHPLRLLTFLLLCTGVAASSSGSETSLTRGIEVRAQGSMQEALEILNTLALQDPSDPLVQLELAVTHYWQGNGEAAHVHINRALAHATKNQSVTRPTLLQLKGRILLSLNQRADAKRALREAIEIEPQNAIHWAALGTVYRAGLELSRADQAYSEALSLDQGCDEALSGSAELKKTTRWEIQATVRASTAATNESAVGKSWVPGGELYARYRSSPETFTFARLTQQLPRWGDPGGPDGTLPSSVLTRGEWGVLIAPTSPLKLGMSYLLTKSQLPTHHALLLDTSYQLGSHVLLLSARPGLDVAAGADLLLQSGLQKIFSQKAWAMLQVFHYRSWPSGELAPQQSTTVVGTVAIDITSSLNLRGGGGVGSYSGGLGIPAYGNIRVNLSPRWNVTLNYEFFGGFFIQHQLGSTVGVQF